MTKEFEHTHAVDFGHEHHHDGTAHDHSAPADSHDSEEHETEGESVPMKHSHVLAITVDAPMLHADLLVTMARPQMGREVFRIDAVSCPEGPTFPFEKPPQLV